MARHGYPKFVLQCLCGHRHDETFVAYIGPERTPICPCKGCWQGLVIARRIGQQLVLPIPEDLPLPEVSEQVH